ncbi:MAG: hypothetical protein HYU56_01140 [Candidatus Aenigmarchaeota archaeon]|nr:hypothetical protein [Candidatus Aenigmarchaeota archaeon]
MSITKGQSVLVSHAFIVGMSVVLIIIVIATMKTTINDNRDFVGRNEITQVCSIMKSSFEKMLLEQVYISPTNASGGRITVSLPQRIADMGYRTRLSENDVIIETNGDLLINETCKIGLNSTYSGSTKGGRTLFELIRYSNGTREIKIGNV